LAREGLADDNRHVVLSHDDHFAGGEAMRIRKRDLVAQVAAVTNLTNKDAEAVVTTIFEEVATALSKGDKVELRGFGSFRVRRRRPRAARNPKTGVPVEVPAKRVPFFRPGKHLRELLDPPTVRRTEPATLLAG